MTDPGRETSENKRKVTLLTALAVLVALVFGVAAGAFAYREYRSDRDASPASAANKQNNQGNQGGNGQGNLAPVVGTVAGNGAPGNEFDAQFNTSSLWPEFNPDRYEYVTRCVPSRVMVQVKSKPDVKVKVWANPAASGRFAAEARPLPGQAFRVRIIPDDGEARTYRIRCLPANFPEWRYEKFSNPPQGMFLVSAAASGGDFHRAWSMVFDSEGMPRWWFSTAANALGGDILRDGRVQLPRGFADGFGKDARTATEILGLDGKRQRLASFEGAPNDGHEFVLLPNGNILVMSYKPRYGVDLRSVGGRANRGVLDGAFQEQTPDGKVVWEWNSKDHIGLDETPKRWWERAWRNPHFDEDGRIRYDYFHLNSIEPWRDMYVLSTRHTDAVWGISKKTGKVVWKLGGVPSEKSLEILGDDPFGGYPLSGNHDARMVGDVLTVHDNGVKINGRPSRAVRYRINLEDRTATYLGDFRDKKAVGSGQCCGSFRPFGDGWLVGWGGSPWVSGFDHDGKLAFRLGVRMPPYRAVPVPDSVSAADLDAGMTAMEPDPPMTRQPISPLDFFDNRNLEDSSIPGRKLGKNVDDDQSDLDKGINVINGQ